jgi:hypothetical protein
MTDIRKEMREILNIGNDETFYLRTDTIRRWLNEVEGLPRHSKRDAGNSEYRQ